MEKVTGKQAFSYFTPNTPPPVSANGKRTPPEGLAATPNHLETLHRTIESETSSASGAEEANNCFNSGLETLQTFFINLWHYVERSAFYPPIKFFGKVFYYLGIGTARFACFTGNILDKFAGSVWSLVKTKILCSCEEKKPSRIEHLIRRMVGDRSETFKKIGTEKEAISKALDFSRELLDMTATIVGTPPNLQKEMLKEALQKLNPDFRQKLRRQLYHSWPHKSEGAKTLTKILEETHPSAFQNRFVTAVHGAIFNQLPSNYYPQIYKAFIVAQLYETFKKSEAIGNAIATAGIVENAIVKKAPTTEELETLEKQLEIFKKLETAGSAIAAAEIVENGITKKALSKEELQVLKKELEKSLKKIAFDTGILFLVRTLILQGDALEETLQQLGPDLSSAVRGQLDLSGLTKAKGENALKAVLAEKQHVDVFNLISEVRTAVGNALFIPVFPGNYPQLSKTFYEKLIKKCIANNLPMDFHNSFIAVRREIDAQALQEAKKDAYLLLQILFNTQLSAEKRNFIQVGASDPELKMDRDFLTQYLFDDPLSDDERKQLIKGIFSLYSNDHKQAIRKCLTVLVKSITGERPDEKALDNEMLLMKAIDDGPEKLLSPDLLELIRPLMHFVNIRGAQASVKAKEGLIEEDLYFLQQTSPVLYNKIRSN